ncbi:hypothetical protein A0256_05995 [Mucilaginibacter sp. PAMC 26640]|nr:hypothetical protein A0256_05995 [Mucilaginibacter sp. PAMC 26640]
MLTRDDVLKTVSDLPLEFSFDDIVDRLLLLDKIDLGVEQSDNDETVSTPTAQIQLSKWLK